MNTCGGCPSTWTGERIAHCSACHRTFSTPALFDLHRRPNRGCLDPASVVIERGKHAGRPALRLGERGVWIGGLERPKHLNREELEQ